MPDVAGIVFGHRGQRADRMRSHRLSIFVYMLGFTCGCVTEPPRTDVVPPTNPLWTPGVAAEKAKELSPEAAKAVLVARAYLDERAKQSGRSQPQYLAFEPTRTNSGWEVRVKFVARWENGEPVEAQGYEVVVALDPQWKVTRFGAGE